MQSQTTPQFKDIPDEAVQEHIIPCFENGSTELKNLALTNKTLNYVVTGNQDAAQKILEKYPQLIIIKGSVIDPSGRHFKNISAFELCLWTLDVRYMGAMMLNCISKATDKDKIKLQLEKQYNNIKDKGVTYTFDKKIVTESHFDFKPLIDALDTYVQNHPNWNNEQRINHWCKMVGKEQAKLPMHVRHHYCNPDESFVSIPLFGKKKLNRSLDFYDYRNNKELVWDSELIGLGVNFAVIRAGGPQASAWIPAPRRGLLLLVNADLAAIRGLYKMRTEDLELLEKQLIQPNHPAEEIQKLSLKTE